MMSFQRPDRTSVLAKEAESVCSDGTGIHPILLGDHYQTESVREAIDQKVMAGPANRTQSWPDRLI